MKWIAIAIFAAVALSLPFVAGDFYINLASQIFIAAIFALSLNLLVGFGGMTSLGHASYLGVAAYLAALLTSRYGFGHGAAALISILGTVAMAAFFGVIALRATGLGFLMITLALSQVLWGLAYRMSNITNGDNGITGMTRPAPFGISLESATSFYWFALAVTVLSFVMMAIFVSSSFGSSLKGVRDQPRRMAALGFNPWMIRWITFIYAGFWGAIAGLLYVYYNKYIHPTSLSTTSSAEALLGCHCRRLRRSRRARGWRGAGAFIEELCFRLYRALEHAARPRVPVHCAGDADRHRAGPAKARRAFSGAIVMTAPSPDFALEIIGLNKAFGGLKVTQDVSLSIKPGERRLIIGPNGAGKTTLFNQISGDMRPNAGQIKLFGEDVTGLRLISARIAACPAPIRSSRCSRAIRSNTMSRSACLACCPRAGRCGGRSRPIGTWRMKPAGRSTASACCIWPVIPFPISPMAKSAGSNSRWRCRKSRACCCSTNRSPASPTTSGRP